MKKLYLLIFLPSLLLSQNIPIIDVGLKLQTSLGNYQNNTPIIYTNNPYYNNFSPSAGVVVGANLKKFKLGAEVLYNFFGPNINEEEYFPAFAGLLTSDGAGGFTTVGAHGDYTLTNIEEAQNSLQLNLFFYYNVINNLYLGISPYFTSVKNVSIVESWVEDFPFFDSGSSDIVLLVDMVAQNRAEFSWQESGINLSVSYKFLSFIFDLKFPLISATTSVTGDHVELGDLNNPMQTFEFNKDYLRKPLLFSVTYLIF